MQWICSILSSLLSSDLTYVSVIALQKENYRLQGTQGLHSDINFSENIHNYNWPSVSGFIIIYIAHRFEAQ